MAGRQEKLQKSSQRSNSSFQENNKMQDLIAYTYGSVTKDQSGPWGFAVKQGATAIHEDSAAFTVSASSFNLGDGSSHACPPPLDYLKRWLRTHMPSSSDSMSLLQKVEW